MATRSDRRRCSWRRRRYVVHPFYVLWTGYWWRAGSTGSARRRRGVLRGESGPAERGAGGVLPDACWGIWRGSRSGGSRGGARSLCRCGSFWATSWTGTRRTIRRCRGRGGACRWRHTRRCSPGCWSSWRRALSGKTLGIDSTTLEGAHAVDRAAGHGGGIPAAGGSGGGFGDRDGRGSGEAGPEAAEEGVQRRTRTIRTRGSRR